MDNYHKLCKEYLEKIKPLLNDPSDTEYDTLVKLCGTGDAVTMADVKYRCEVLFKKLKDHNDPDIDTLVQEELVQEAEAEEEAAEQQRKAAEEQRQAEEAAEQQRKAEADAEAAEQQRKASEELRQAEEAARLAEEEAAEQQRKAEADAEAAEQQRKAAEVARLEEEEAAEQQRKAAEELRRKAAEEQRQAEEAARLAAEKRQKEEVARLAAEDAARQEEEQRRQAEKLRKAEAERQAAEKQQQADAEAARLAEEAARLAAEEAARLAEEKQAAEKQILLNKLNDEYINMQLGDIKTKSINSVFNVFSKSPNMSDEQYAIVKTISDYIAKSTDWDVESSDSLAKIVDEIKNNTIVSNDYFQSILSDISNIKNSGVAQQNKKYIDLVDAFNTNVKYVNGLRGNNRQNIMNDTYGGMSFGGDDDYSDGRMALGGVMGGAILFSENAVAILMVTCIVLLMYLIHILYYQPCSGYKNRGHIYCGSLQNNEAIQYMAY